MVAEMFNDYAADYDRAVGGTAWLRRIFTRAKADRISEIVAFNAGETQSRSVLNIGCGTGSLDALIASRFIRFLGVDISSKSIEIARERNPCLSYVAYDGCELPCQRKEFDVVLLVNVLHHVDKPDRSALIKEAFRVLRNDGLIIVIEHNPLNLIARIAVALCPFDKGVGLLSRTKTCELLRSVGSQIINGRLFFGGVQYCLAVKKTKDK